MATLAVKPRIAEIPTDVEVDPVTLDIIEGALKNARFEMDAVLFRSAMSPVIREQHDEFPMLTDPRGRMVVGQSSQFGHMMDAGGPLAGSLPTGARTIFEEGVNIPPVKIIERGVVQED